MRGVYLDYAATTPLDPEVREAMRAVEEVFGNPSSIHRFGQEARKVLEEARERVAEALRRQHPEIASYLAAHREELEQRFQRKYPEAAQHIHELRQRLHQPPEDETKEQR